MPLPVGGRSYPWPPPAWAEVLLRMAEYDAWYSGDPDRLSQFYGSAMHESDRVRWWQFWRRVQTTQGQQSRAQLHVPLAGDIAATSAALLFSERPKIEIVQAHPETADQEETAEVVAAREAEDRMLRLLDAGDLYPRLAEGAEQASALGGVFLKTVVDREVFGEGPFVAVQPADSAIPVFRWGKLVEVSFWRVLRRDASQDRVVRHIEHHSTNEEGRGVIEHAVYSGTRQNLGSREQLTRYEETAALEDIEIRPHQGLAVDYVPNLRPARAWRNVAIARYLGQSDYSGIEGLMDALDEAYTSWMRDLRLGKARIIVPQEALKVTPGVGARADMDQEIFTPLAIEPDDQSRMTFTVQQGDIRHEAHESTVENLMIQAVSMAGYSPQTFGIVPEGQGRAVTATEIKARERKSQATRERKSAFWRDSIEAQVSKLLAVARTEFGISEFSDAYRIRATIFDGIPDDFEATARSIEMVRRSESMSREEAVRALHPEWEPAQVQAEVSRLEAEFGGTVRDPAALFPDD
jgi:A118 family predicted phage portal protein